MSNFLSGSKDTSVDKIILQKTVWTSVLNLSSQMTKDPEFQHKVMHSSVKALWILWNRCSERETFKANSSYDHEIALEVNFSYHLSQKLSINMAKS